MSSTSQATTHHTAPAIHRPPQPTPDKPATSPPLTTMGPPPPRLSISSLRDMELLWEFNKKYLGQLDYDPTAASLGKSFYDNYLSLSAVDNDICPNTTSSTQPLLPCNLLCSSFGKPSASQPFIQDACFETSYVLILKSGYFEPMDILALHLCNHSYCLDFAPAYTYATTTFSGSPSTTLTGMSSRH
jgi:hypothetical protein